MTIKTLKALKELAILIITALIITFLVRTFLAQPFKVEMGSMIPTIRPGERIFADRLSYRFRLPKRKEIIVLEAPDALQPQNNLPLAIGGEQKRTLIKRIIGLPGEKLLIRRGAVFINNKKLKESYKVAEEGNYGPIAISKNSYFVMGDNRPYSRDSRSFGAISKNNIVGRAIFVYWPPQKIRLLTNNESVK